MTLINGRAYGIHGEPAAHMVNLKPGEGPVLELVHVQADVRGLFLETEVEQHYVNPQDNEIEIVYTFPLPWGAELLEAEAWIGERHLVGRVREKKEAASRYEKAIAAGNSALLLEASAEGLWRMSLGNLGANERCRLRIRYAKVLAFSEDNLRVIIPTTVAPRYADSARGTYEWEEVTSQVHQEYPFTIRVRIHDALSASVISSPSHPIRTQVHAGLAEVALTRKADLDRDFVLQLDQVPSHSLAVIANDEAEEVLLASFHPALPPGQVTTKGIKILVDCSGSMAGDSIAAAQKTLTSFITGLNPGDRISLSRFGSTFEHRSNGLWRINEKTRIAALRWVQGLKADLGGTEMEAALVSTFSLQGEDMNDVLLLTDGEISAVDSTVEAARVSGHRIFVVGIGSSPAEPLLRKLAETTGGACEFVAPGEDVAQAIERMIARLSHGQRVSHLALEWPEGTQPIWHSPLPLAVFDGDTVSVYARVRQGVSGVLRLRGVVDDAVSSSCLGEVELGARAPAGVDLIRMAASREVRMLIDAKKQKAALALSLKHQLINELTSAVMVLKRKGDDKLGDMPDLVIVDQMLPAGWGGAGSVSGFGGALGFGAVMGHVSSLSSTMERMMSPCVRANRSSAKQKTTFMQKPVQVRSPTATYDTGMTPLLLANELAYIPDHQWPPTYHRLRLLGLSAVVVDWLELVMAPAMGLTERQAVSVFASLFASRDITKVLKGELPISVLGTDAYRAMLCKALDGITEASWPACMGDLEWVG